MGKHTAAIRAVPLIQVNERATKNDGDLKMMATCLVVSKKSWRGFERGSGRGWVVVVVVGGGGKLLVFVKVKGCIYREGLSFGIIDCSSF